MMLLEAALSTAAPLPDIPRALTGLAEWGACLVYLLLIPRRGGVRRFVAVAAAGLGVLVGVQVLAGHLPLRLWTLGMLLSALSMFGFILTAARVSLRDAGYFAARALVLAELVAALHWQIHYFVFLRGGAPPGQPWPALLGVGMYAASLALAFGIEMRHFRRTSPLDVSSRELASAAAIALVTFFMSNISFLNANTPFSGRLGPEIFYIRTLVDLCGFVALYAQQGQRMQLQAKAELKAIDGILRSQHDQYLQSKRSIEIVNRKYHDLKHQIGIIRAEGDPAKKASYLDELEASIRGYEAQSDTGSSVLDVILTTKQMECAERGIDLTCVVDGQLLDFMSVMDIAAVFGNALDNAVDGVMQVPDPDQRLIKLAVFAQANFVMIAVENYFTGDLRLEDGAIVTRRADRDRHGYGLKSIRYTAEKYGGSMTVHAEDDWFTLRILLPVPAGVRPRRAPRPTPAAPPPRA
jgi:hypothetical protein